MKTKEADALVVFRKMEKMQGGAVKGKATDNEREAQELVYSAWEAAGSEDAYVLLRNALELDPDNVDAWLGLMDYESMTDDEAVEFLRKVVDIGKRNLGPKTFNDCKGVFWGMLETRPYMRARHRLAILLMDIKRYAEAVSEYEAMLELNPNDNQGARYDLMSCYLAINRIDGARKLFEKYDEKGFSAQFAWAYVLERFISGNPDEAAQALDDARKQNSHAMAYFLEHRKLPKIMPAGFGIGSKEEAIIAWDTLRHAWSAHPSAQAWLRSQKS